MKVIGYIVTVVFTMALSMIYSGYALSVLWGWFIAPTFEIQELTIPSAIGLAMVVNYLTQRWDIDKDDEEGFGEKLKKAIVVAALKPSFALGFGWLVTLFI